MLVPDAPVNLFDLPAVTKANKIGLVWDEGDSSGGEAIIDYRIFYDQSSNTWTELVSGVTDPTYTTDTIMTKGHTY